METLRTPYQLTEEQQKTFYHSVICNRNSPHRYWSIWCNYKKETPDYRDGLEFVGFGGLTNIQWENRLAEISLIIDPSLRGKGVGEKAVDLILDKAFNYMNLQTVCGECYNCNPAIEFWLKIAAIYKLGEKYLPNRKYWKGKFYDSLYFSIDRGDYVK